ncbi:MAG TPA: ATP-binding protein [Anaerolineaceae bacterium]|nr:ATP-binding protein [Anaerolineaceae bacterium]
MRNRLILTYAFVMLLTIIIAFSSAIVFLSNASVDYLSRSQIAHSYPYMQDLAEYYSSHGGWEGVDAYFTSSDLSEADQLFFREQHIALVSPEGDVIFAMDKEMEGTKSEPFYLIFASRIQSGGKLFGYLVSGHFLNRMPPNFSRTLLQLLWKSLSLATLVTLIIGLFLAILMASRLLRPIEATIKATQKISEGDLKQRLPVHSYKDLKDLTTAVNDMAVNLEKNDLKRSSLFSDLAHDLRTPLAVQRASIEAVEDGIYPFNQETLTMLKQQNTHLVRLVEDLSLVAMLDEGMFTPRKSSQDLAEFTRSVISRFESMLIKQQRRVRLIALQRGMIVEIDIDRIEQILENLFQNAMRYTPEGSTIDVAVYQKENLAILTVRDHGPGIPPDKLETIFDRYYQLNCSEVPANGGQGMGLAIARRLARVHGGNLYVRNHPRVGAEFVLELPLLRLEKPSRSSNKVQKS